VPKPARPWVCARRDEDNCQLGLFFEFAVMTFCTDLRNMPSAAFVPTTIGVHLQVPPPGIAERADGHPF